MANQLNRLSNLRAIAPTKSAIFSSFCTDSVQLQSGSNNEADNLQEKNRQDQVRKLSTLLRKKRFKSARTTMVSLVLPGSPFSSPADLISVFSQSFPSPKPIFTDMLLSICAELKLPDEATEVYNSIRKEGNFPCSSAFKLFLESLVSSGHYNRTIDIFWEVINSGFRVDRFAYSKAIESAVKLGDLTKAMNLLNYMKRHGVSPNAFIYNVLINGFCKEKRTEDARKLFDEMIETKVTATMFTYSTLIAGYCKVFDMENALEIQRRMKGENMESNLVTFNTLIDGYGRICQFENCFEILNEMENKGIVPNEITYGSLVYNLCKDGRLCEAELIMRDMENRKIIPNAQIYNSLIMANIEERKMEDAKRIVEEMKGRGLLPNEDTYCILIKGHCGVKDFVGAYGWYRELIQNGLVLNMAVCNELICGLREEGMESEILSIRDYMNKQTQCRRSKFSKVIERGRGSIRSCSNHKHRPISFFI
ncbi:pentatricopeptide repeat-containing protein At5g12100, mitochondrial-like [Impatiens glandulifera]|uniref:pentatricopeptide repeat-containing protein At5g12100, mitochondrial-like n=1 Tax=Impatiens glandulifera TaxID=253017 RepID=UPI001FB090DD|nr:pentatricopeptide repeat-containing protein At5g12100, mitochondrial-like [Impatiens glandulifera]